MNKPKQENKQTEIPPFPFPFEYCTIERAAKLFNCEVEDINHLQSIGAISFYVNFEEQEFFSSFSANAEILSDGFIAGELCTSSIDRQLCGMSAQWNKSEEVEIDEGFIEIKNASVWAYGFMKVSLDMLADLKALAFHIQSEQSHDGESELIFYKQYDADEIEYGGLPVFLLLREDLNKIHRSIHSGERLDNIFNNKDLAKAHAEKQEHPKKQPRVESSQSTMIVALLECLPELKAKLEKGSEEEAPIELNKYLRKKELAEMHVSGKTLKRWINSARR
jgi:hypothetical protein